VHLNQTDLAKRWRLSPRTLERWRWAGRGPPILKIGGRCLYRLEDVEAFEADRLRSATSRQRQVRQRGRKVKL
jgi:predicted site-specific integrase-resolvase